MRFMPVLRAAILGLSLKLILACAICPQEMRTHLKQYYLAGNVRSVDTTVVDMSTKSYKLHPSGREELENFGNPSQGSPGSPLLVDALKFDSTGKLLEDIDFERSIEQESYRYVYTYNHQGLLVERVGYRENGSPDERTVYSYGPGGRKTEELIYSGTGRVQARLEFDEHENVVSVESYKEDGSVREKVNHRFEYSTEGNTLEQIYYPPERQSGSGMAIPQGQSTAQQRPMVAIPLRYRTVVVRDDAGRVREERRYDVDGSLHEKKVFDQNGILRNSEWRLGEMAVTTTSYDDQGREVEDHTTAKEGLPLSKAIDTHTLFSYDEHGNLTDQITNGADGSLIARTTNVFVYDSHGNWVNKTETVLNNTWKTEPFPAAFETVRQFHRIITYFPEK